MIEGLSCLRIHVRVKQGCVGGGTSLPTVWPISIIPCRDWALKLSQPRFLDGGIARVCGENQTC